MKYSNWNRKNTSELRRPDILLPSRWRLQLRASMSIFGSPWSEFEENRNSSSCKPKTTMSTGNRQGKSFVANRHCDSSAVASEIRRLCLDSYTSLQYRNELHIFFCRRLCALLCPTKCPMVQVLVHFLPTVSRDDAWASQEFNMSKARHMLLECFESIQPHEVWGKRKWSMKEYSADKRL